jgi:hypothetical protein
MRLLTAHKILISAALALGVILAIWGVVHGRRGDPGAWSVFALGVAMLPAGLLYLRKLYRNPPIR